MKNICLKSIRKSALLLPLGGSKYNLNTVYSTGSSITRVLNAHNIDEAGNILATAINVWSE
jgi:hypothetical protein